MEQKVFVTSVYGQQALVRGGRVKACGSCAGKSSCSTLGSWVERFIEMPVENSLGAKPGDEVIISCPDDLILRVTAKIYALPVIAFLLGLFLGGVSAPTLGVDPDVSALFTGGVFLFAAFFLAKRTFRNNDVVARVERIISSPMSTIPIRSQMNS